MFQEVAAPVEEEPNPAEASAPLQELGRVPAVGPADAGVSLSISQGNSFIH